MVSRLVDRLAGSPFLFHWLRKLPEANYRATKQRLAALRDRLEPARVLDLGCGTGECAHLFAPEGYLGLDIDPGYVRYATQRSPRHRFLCADALVWPGEGDPFDLVLVNGVLHHHDDATVGSLLQAARGQLAPHGALVVIEDARLADEGPWTKLVHALDHGSFVRTPEEWMRLVGSTVEIQHAETYVSGLCPYRLMMARA